MGTTTHRGSIDIEAPVTEVFAHVADPRNFYDALAPDEPPTIINATKTDDGVVTKYAWNAHPWAHHYLGGTMTREEFVPDQRIVDRSSEGPVWTFEFEETPTGTTVTVTFELVTKIALLDKIEDRVAWDGDRDLARMLATFKAALET